MPKFYILLVMLASLFLGCGSYDEMRSFYAEKCGNDYYDYNVQFCEDSKIYDKCGGYSYSPLNEKCENNTLLLKCGNDYYDYNVQFCRNDKIYDKCGGSSYNPLNQKCENNILLSKCWNDYYDPMVQFCQNDKIYDKCGGYSYDPLTQECENNSLLSKCGDELYDPFSQFCADNAVENKEEFTDSRDGKVYKYITIGTQTWMAENLQYETSKTKCYDNNPSNCKIYGILYDWNTAKEVCPSGWHLPNDTEWFMLRNFADNNNAKLMANNVLWISGRGTDDFGFSALPGGYYRHEGYFLSIDNQAIFWSATAGSYSGSAHVHHFTLQPGIRDIDGLYTNNSWVNVRCIKDI